MFLEDNTSVKTIYKENVPETAEAVIETIRDMIEVDGVEMIFATSFGYRNFVMEVAEEYPDIKFMQSSGLETSENVAVYFGKIDEPRYLTGMVAGMHTKTDIIGYVAAFEIPQVIRGINAFTMGVQAVNPDAKVVVEWSSSWGGQQEEREATEVLISKGADVIAQHQNTPKPQIVAEENGVYSIGYHADMHDKAPEAHLTAAVWNWGPYYQREVEKAMNGTWEAENYWGGMNDNVVEISPIADFVENQIKDLVSEYETKIKDGSFKIFEGPIYDRNGALRVEEGVEMTDTELLDWDWFVDGVEAE